MSIIVPTIAFANSVDDGDGWVISWAMANGDTGLTVTKPPTFIGFADRSVQVDGTLGAGFNLSWEGSNDGVNFHTLRDPFNNLLNITAADIYEVLQVVVFARPRVTNGDGTTAVTVTALYRRTKP
jgi:hypothetical protein